jgi:hypothetical protein
MMNKKIILGFFTLLLALSISFCSGPEEKKMKFFNKGQTLYEQGDYVDAPALNSKMRFRSTPSSLRGTTCWGCRNSGSRT